MQVPTFHQQTGLRNSKHSGGGDAGIRPPPLLRGPTGCRAVPPVGTPLCQVSGHSLLLGEDPVFAGCQEEEEECEHEHVAWAVPVGVTIKSQREPGDSVASMAKAAQGGARSPQPKTLQNHQLGAGGHCSPLCRGSFFRSWISASPERCRIWPLHPEHPPHLSP